MKSKPPKKRIWLRGGNSKPVNRSESGEFASLFLFNGTKLRIILDFPKFYAFFFKNNINRREL